MINFSERDTTIEYSVVGAMLIDASCVNAALAIVTPEDFSDRLCRAAVQAVTELRSEAKAMDAVLIYDRAKRLCPDLTYDFAKECMAVCATAANIEEYCKIVKAAANTERLASIAESINERIFEHEAPESIIASLKQSVDEISLSSSEVLSSRNAADAWLKYDEVVKADPESAYCKTGFSGLDIILGGGMFNAGLYIIGARPGMGKTTLGLGIAENIASRGKPVLFVSLEMGKVQIMAKRLARKTRLSYTRLMTGGYGGVKHNLIDSANRQLAETPFYLSDKSLCRISDIESMAHGVKDLACIVVDYFGLLTVEQDNGVRSRYEETTELSKGLKSLAKRLNIPLVVLCQLNRENGTRTDKRPKLSDLRDTGALEQDADCVILLHREEYYKAHDENYEPPESEFIELNVAKNRHGETQVYKMLWDGVTGGINEVCYRTDEPNGTKDKFELPF